MKCQPKAPMARRDDTNDAEIESVHTLRAIAHPPSGRAEYGQCGH